MKFAVIGSGGVTLGEVELSGNPDDWANMGSYVCNRRDLSIQIKKQGVIAGSIIYEPQGGYSRPVFLGYVTRSVAVGDTVIIGSATIALEHEVAERFITRGFYE